MAFPDLSADPTDPEFNTYADFDQATDLLASRVGAAAWEDVEEEDQARALVTATRDIDAIEGTDWRFIGSKADVAQPLEWPRSGTVYASDELPGRLAQATIELAFVYALAAAADASLDVLNPAATTIKREKVGPLETEYFTPPVTTATGVDRFPLIVQRLLAPLLRVTTPTTSWGSAITSRGS